jgi:hypothetical protein
MKRSERKALYEKYNCNCAYCGTHIRYEDLKIDYNTFEDAKTNPESALPICMSCFNRKHTQSIEQFRQMILYEFDCDLKGYRINRYLTYDLLRLKSLNFKFYFEKLQQKDDNFLHVLNDLDSLSYEDRYKLKQLTECILMSFYGMDYCSICNNTKEGKIENCDKVCIGENNNGTYLRNLNITDEFLNVLIICLKNFPGMNINDSDDNKELPWNR